MSDIRLIPHTASRYAATNDGRIFVRSRNGGGWTEMNPSQRRNGLLVISLLDENHIRRCRTVNSIIRECFGDRLPEVPECDGLSFFHIDGFANYVAGSDGSVWSRTSGKWKRLKAWKPDSYWRVSMRANGKTHCRLLHVVVLEAFTGPRPAGKDACHYDGDTDNNFISNLRWDTRSGNMQDAIRHGTISRGEKHGNSKLDATSVARIRQMVDDGIPHSQIAAAFGVSRSNIGAIKNGISWGHLTTVPE